MYVHFGQRGGLNGWILGTFQTHVFLNVATMSKIPIFVSDEAEVGSSLYGTTNERKERPSVSKTGEAEMLQRLWVSAYILQQSDVLFDDF